MNRLVAHTAEGKFPRPDDIRPGQASKRRCRPIFKNGPGGRGGRAAALMAAAPINNTASWDH